MMRHAQRVTPHGPAIRAIRDANGRSLRLVAETAGISTTYLAQIERGEKAASPDVIQRIAEALAVSVDAITREDPDMPAVPEDDALRLYSIKQAAALLGISASWLTKAVSARAVEYTLLDPLKTGKGRAMFSRAQLQQLINDSVSRPLTGASAA